MGDSILRPPAPGAAVMPCAGCRRMLPLPALRWLPAGTGNRCRPRIGCNDCAQKDHP